MTNKYKSIKYESVNIQKYIRMNLNVQTDVLKD